MSGYMAYNLTKEARERILTSFTPRYSKVIAHHITIAFGVEETYPCPDVAFVKVVGYAYNEKIEALVVEVSGQKERPDGKLFHITLSHSEEAKPVMSNDLLLQTPYTPIDPFMIPVEKKFNKF